jgi:hypothetical protein
MNFTIQIFALLLNEDFNDMFIVRDELCSRILSSLSKGLEIITLSSSETGQDLSEAALLQTTMIFMNEYSMSESQITLESMHN